MSLEESYINEPCHCIVCDWEGKRKDLIVDVDGDSQGQWTLYTCPICYAPDIEWI